MKSKARTKRDRMTEPAIEARTMSFLMFDMMDLQGLGQWLKKMFLIIAIRLLQTQDVRPISG
jgi:hypothetical protein